MLSTCPFFLLFSFFRQPWTKIVTKTKNFPFPQLSILFLGMRCMEPEDNNIETGGRCFFRSRLCNAEKQCFCQDILFGVVAILLVLAIIGFLLSPLSYFNLVTFRGTLMDISTFNILVSICSNMFCTTNKIIF